MIYVLKYQNNDFELMKDIMKRAFDYDSNLHLGRDGGPDGYQDGSFIRKWFLHPHATPFSIFLDDKLIGAINLFLSPSNNHKIHVGCFFIDPDYEDKGYGTTAFKKVETMFSDTICWTTETPSFSLRNHHFYINKLGFKCIKIENPKSFEEGMFILEKKIR